MTYYYELNKTDIKNLGLIPTNAKKYEVCQSGWTCIFGKIYEVIHRKNYGDFKGKNINTKDLTNYQENYILKNCKHKEY